MQSTINYLMNLLARREYSEYELRYKLQSKNISAPEIDAAIEQLQTKSWQNDLRFAESYIRCRSQNGYGNLKITLELKQKGVSNENIALAMQQTNIDWIEVAKKVILKKAPKKSLLNLKTKQKVWRYMINHGFHAEDFAPYINLNSELSH